LALDRNRLPKLIKLANYSTSLSATSTHLFQIGRNENEIATADAQLSNTDKHVHKQAKIHTKLN